MVIGTIWMNKKLFNIVMAVWVICVIVPSSLVVYWMAIDDNPPLEFLNDELEILNDEPIFAGDELRVRSKFCKFTTAEVEMRISYLSDDGFAVNVPLRTPPNAGRGCSQRISAYVLPVHIPAGDYKMHITYVYQINPLRTRSVDIMSEVFRVEYR